MTMHSSFFPDCFHRVTVKGLFVRDGKVLLVKEGAVYENKWEIPGGGLDFGEDIKVALKREVKEEMGLNVTKISEKPVYVFTHRYENNIRNIGWYYTLVIAYRIELENLNFTPTEECEEIGFYSKEDLIELDAKKQLAGQANQLTHIFNPEDFKENF